MPALGTLWTVPDVAIGKVDVSVAESGISLSLQLAPILAANSEREQNLLSVMDQMFFDLRTMWFPTYEAATYDAEVTAIVGDPMPKNREAKITELINLKTAGLLSAEEVRKELVALGYDIDPATDKLLAEATASAAAADPFGKRVEEELGGTGTGSPDGAPQGAPVAT